MFHEYTKNLQSLYDISDKYSHQIRELWMSNVFLTWRWYLCLAITIVSWVIWIIFRKKDSTARLLLAGSVVTFIAMIMDDIGVELSIWSYNVDIDAITPSFIMWDMSVLPVVTMLFLQYKPNVNPFIKAVIYSGLGSFVAQPLISLIGFYAPGEWKHYYSFPILIAIYLIANFCVTRPSFEKL